MHRVIGGEFDIDINEISTGNPKTIDGAFFSSGRAALYHILLDIQNNSRYKNILLPDYLCESVLDTVRRFQFKIGFYELDLNLSIDEADFSRKYTAGTIVLIINFFGYSDCASQIKFIRSHAADACIIEDNVQAFYEMKHDSDSDYSFTSFRKAFAVPDGAVVKSKSGRIRSAVDENTFAEYKSAAAILKHISFSDTVDENKYLDLFRKGESKIDENINAKMSGFTATILSATNFSTIAEKRIENATFIIEGLSELNIKPVLPLDSAKVPLFVPIRLKNRDAVRSELFKKNTFCPVHWPLPTGYELTRGQEMAENELSIIIDQRCSIDDMKRILNVLKKTGAHGI